MIECNLFFLSAFNWGSNTVINPQPAYQGIVCRKQLCGPGPDQCIWFLVKAEDHWKILSALQGQGLTSFLTFQALVQHV